MTVCKEARVSSRVGLSTRAIGKCGSFEITKV